MLKVFSFSVSCSVDQSNVSQSTSTLNQIKTIFTKILVIVAAYQIFVMTTPRHTMELQKLGWWLGAVSVISLQFSESLNPIFYNLASRRVQNTVLILKNLHSQIKKISNLHHTRGIEAYAEACTE